MNQHDDRSYDGGHRYNGRAIIEYIKMTVVLIMEDIARRSCF